MKSSTVSRYPTLNVQHFTPAQVRHQYDGGDKKYLDEIVQLSERRTKKYGEGNFRIFYVKLINNVLIPG